MFKQKKLSLGARLGLSVASFLLGILLFAAAVTTALIADFQVMTSADSISDVIIDILFPSEVKQNKPAVNQAASGLRVAPVGRRNLNVPRRDEPAGVASSLTNQLIGMLYEELGDQLGEEMPVSLEDFTALINQSTAKDYIADKTAALISDYFKGEVNTTFEPEEIITLIEENAQLIETIVGEPLPADIAQQVATVFDENEIVQKVEKEGLAGFMALVGGDSSDDALAGDAAGTRQPDLLNGVNLNTVNDAVATVRAAASVPNLIWGIVICLVLIAAIILVNIRQISKGLRRCGYPLLIAGLGIVPSLLAHFAPGLWTTAPELAGVRRVFILITPINAIVFCLGLALVIAGIVLGIVLRKKQTVTVPASPETEELAAAIVDETPVEISCEPVEEVPEAESSEEEPIAEEAVAEESAEEPAPVGE